MQLKMLLVLPAMVLIGTSAGAQNIDVTGFTNPNAAVASQGSGSNLADRLNGAMWTANAPIPEPQGVAQASVVASADGALLYLIGGGVGSALATTNRLRIYNVANDAWTDGAPIPGSGMRSFGSAVELDGFIYVFGGLDGTTLPAPTVLNTTWIYDEANDSWAQGATMPAPRFGSAVATRTSTAIWVIGGYGGLEMMAETRTVWKYDPETNSYSTGYSDMPVPLGRIHGVQLDGGLVHVFAGGFDGVNHLVYSAGANSWSIAPAMPFGVTDPATVTDGSLIYLAGGGGMAPRGPGRTQIYDPATQTWSQGPAMPAPAVDNTAGALAGGTFFVLGGFNGSSAAATNYSLVLF